MDGNNIGAVVAIRLINLFLLTLLIPAESAQAQNFGGKGHPNYCHSKGLDTDLNLHYRRAAVLYWPENLTNNWCSLRAVCLTESNENPKAVSPVGAVGLCQIMPATWRETQTRFSLRGNMRKAVDSIEASAAYLSVQMGIWVTHRSNKCRMELAWASYNAGAGNIIKAQTESGNELCWSGISPHLYKITGNHSIETNNYVDRIWGWHEKLGGHAIE